MAVLQRPMGQRHMQRPRMLLVRVRRAKQPLGRVMQQLRLRLLIFRPEAVLVPVSHDALARWTMTVHLALMPLAFETSKQTNK